MDSFEQAPEFVIDDLETLKAVIDPLRVQILELLVQDALTVKQMAERLGLASSKLYYHVNMLEKYNFVTVVDTRMVANMVEKYYRATAAFFRVDETLLSFQTDSGKDTIHTMLNVTLDTTREDILRSLEARTFELEQGAEEKARRLMLIRATSRLTEEQATEFGSRLDALLADFDAAEDEPTAEPKQPYALTLAFYPSLYFPDTGEQT